MYASTATGGWSLSQFHQHYRPGLKGEKTVFDPRATGRGLSGAIGDVAGTAFGVLPFLAAGITHKPGSGKKAELDGVTLYTGSNDGSVCAAARCPVMSLLLDQRAGSTAPFAPLLL